VLLKSKRKQFRISVSEALANESVSVKVLKAFIVLKRYLGFVEGARWETEGVRYLKTKVTDANQ
jgi:hypothetical protein